MYEIHVGAGGRMANYYIDLGAHIGGTVRQFALENPGYMLFAVEPDTALLSRITDVAREIKQPLCLIGAAAWIYDGVISFYQSGRKSASTVMLGKAEKIDQGWPDIDYTKPTEVPCFDFSKWIAGFVRPGDNLIVKMDIEGSEYPILKKMIEDRTLSLITKLYCEWHLDRFPAISEQEHSKLQETVRSQTILIDWY